jgi:colanic acid/amylovoran biosynthesis glycosyltransferase
MTADGASQHAETKNTKTQKTETKDTDARKRVGVFVGSYLPYSETFIWDQLRNHQRYAPEVFAYQRLHAAKRFPFAAVHALPSLISRLRYQVLGSAPQFDAVFRQARFSILHAHFGTNGAYATKFSKRYRVPLVVTFHGHDVPALVGRSRYTLRYARYAAFAPAMLRHASQLLPASKDLADRLVRQIGADARKVDVLPLGIDLEKFTPAEQKNDPQRGSRTPSVLMVGRFVEKKGHADGLRAFARVLARIPEARLSLIGDGPLRPDYETLVRELGMAHAVRFLGVMPSEQVVEALRQTSVLLCPSCTAPSGDVESGVIVVKEAGGCAIPVIGTRHGGIPEIIDHQETGFLVDEHDVSAMARHLEQLLANEALAKTIGRAARQKTERCFDVTQQIAALEAIYDRFC